MQITKPATPTELLLGLAFDDANGTLAVWVAHSPPVNLHTALTYALSRDEARQLADALTAWPAKS